MKNILGLLLFVFLLSKTIIVDAQKKLPIIQAKAYQQLNIPGTIPVGQQHNFVDTGYKVVLEIMPNKKITLLTAYTGNNVFTVLTGKISSPFTVGIRTTGETEIIRTKMAKHFLLCNLEKKTDSCTVPNKIKLHKNEVVVKLLYNKRAYYYRIKEITELQPEMHP